MTERRQDRVPITGLGSEEDARDEVVRWIREREERDEPVPRDRILMEIVRTDTGATAFRFVLLAPEPGPPIG